MNNTRVTSRVRVFGLGLSLENSLQHHQEVYSGLQILATFHQRPGVKGDFKLFGASCTEISFLFRFHIPSTKQSSKKKHLCDIVKSDFGNLKRIFFIQPLKKKAPKGRYHNSFPPFLLLTAHTSQATAGLNR